MSKKSEEYKNRIDNYQSELASRNMKKELRHTYIKTEANNVLKLKTDNDILKKQLTIYQKLPPVYIKYIYQDLNESNIALTKIKADLQNLQEQFNQLVTELFSSNPNEF